MKSLLGWLTTTISVNRFSRRSQTVRISSMRDFRSSVLWWAVKRRVLLDQPVVIAITGSIAKTTTKLAIGSVLKKHFPGQVRVGYGNLNSFLGVPLSILGFNIDFHKQKISWQWPFILLTAFFKSLFTTLPKYLVLEYGADHKGDIEELAIMLELDIAIVTIIGNAHAANYDSAEDIAVEKAHIFKALKKDGVALINSNDVSLKPSLSSLRTVEVKTETEDIAINFARAVSSELKLDLQTTEEALSVMSRPEGRMQLKDLGGIKLLDDTYNASPLSVEAALKVLSKLPGRRIAVLGDMLELGTSERDDHIIIGKKAREVADQIIAVGELSKSYKADFWYPNSVEAVEPLLKLISDGDSILVKGSRAVKMEIIVKAIIKQYNKK